MTHKLTRTSKSKWMVWGFGLALAALGAWIVVQHFLPVSLIQSSSNQLSNGQIQTSQSTAWKQLASNKNFQKTYRLKKTLNVLGFQLLHLEHRQLPTQFIIIENVPTPSANLLFEKNLDTTMLSTVANQLLSMHKSDQVLTLKLDSLKTLSLEPVSIAGKPTTRRTVDVLVHLSNEPQPRHYEVSVTRYVSGNQLETLVVMFAHTADFQPALVSKLLSLSPGFSETADSATGPTQQAGKP